MKTIMKAAFGVQSYTLGENGLERDVEYPIEVGQILFLSGYGQDEHHHDRLAVYKIENSDFGTKYHCVNIEKLELVVKDHVRPIEKEFGIGIYYKQGDMIAPEELERCLPLAQENKRKSDELAAIKRNEANEKAELAKKWWADNTPSWAKAFIVAEFEVDESDGMSDYHGSKTERTILLAFSDSERNSFPELRTAAKNCGETAFLADLPKEQAEHRENYSGGAGYYLGKSRYSGWKITKTPIRWNLGKGSFVTDPNNIKLPSEKVKTVTGSAPSGNKIATCKLNVEKGGIELYFPGKPQAAVLDDLKASGFRWSRFNSCWYKLDNSIARRTASKYAEVPQEEVNQDGALVEAQENAVFAANNL